MPPHTTGSTPDRPPTGDPHDNDDESSARTNQSSDQSDTDADYDPSKRNFFQYSPDLLAVSTADGRFVDVNQRFEEVLGWTREELTSRPFLDFVHPDDHSATLACLEKSRTGDGEIRGFVNRYERKDGDYVWLEWQSNWSDEEGLIYASARNITDLRQARRERRNLQENALRAHQVESIAALARGIAHKFNNELTTILGNAGLIAQNTEDPDLSDRLEAIQRSAQSADELCRQLLAYAGDEEVDRQPRDLSNLIRSSDQLLASVVNDEISLEFDLADDLPRIPLDAARLRQVAMHLVTNANEAIPNTGQITIRTELRHFTNQQLTDGGHTSDIESGEYAVLEVEDSGVGMDDDTQERMFEPFFTTKFVGRGVGLATTLGIIRSHGGSIQVTSEIDVGSSVSVLLPTDGSNASMTGPARADRLPPGAVLVADDYSVVSLIRRTLSDSHLDVRTASSDTKLFQTVENQSDWLAVIIDPLDPRFREMRVVDRLAGKLPDVPIIASTVTTPDSESQRGDVGLADATLEKPYTAAELIRLLHSLSPSD